MLLSLAGFDLYMYSDFLTPLEISLKTTISATVITFCLGIMTAWWMSGYQ
ncbi:MAG: hypothetical protein RLZZ381_3871, partial [Cyanobacteriota bacterium]